MRITKCASYIKWDIKTDSFILYCDGHKVGLPHNKELSEFMRKTPDLKYPEDTDVVKSMWNARKTSGTLAQLD